MTYFIAMNRVRLFLLLLCAAINVATAAPPIPHSAPAATLIGHAENAIRAGDDRTAEALLSRIPGGSLDAMQFARIQIVRAEIGLRRNQPSTALRSLPASGAQMPALSPQIELLRARAQFMAGDPASAVRTLVAREHRLTSASDIAANRDHIWNGLIATPIAASALSNLEVEEAMTRGWLDLARVLQQGPTPSAVAAWIQRNPGHPGSRKTALVQSTPIVRTPIVAGFPNAASAPGIAFNGGYALLLPTGGGLASAGRAVREGFVSAWFDTPEPRAAIRIYDPGASAAQAVAAYQAAVRDGAGFIVGPLTKDGVAAIAAQGSSTPWLTLNYSDSAAGGAIQFGLAPEDEARAAAIDAIARGHRTALALAPANEWGERALAAFSASFNEQGGTLLQSARYTPGTQDFGKPLRELLKLGSSTQRHQALTAVLGVTSEFEPRPRDDADLLFAPLRAAEARALVPQLNFLRAQNLVTYTVSAAHAGTVGTQLDGLHLCDMPWVLDVAGAWTQARDAARSRFPEVQRDQPRLFALGIDALLLARAWSRGELGGGREIDGASGRLSLAPGNRIVRRLGCPAIRDGRASASR